MLAISIILFGAHLVIDRLLQQKQCLIHFIKSVLGFISELTRERSTQYLLAILLILFRSYLRISQ